MSSVGACPRSVGQSKSTEPPAVRLPEYIGPYKVEGVLGQGSMAIVFDAISPLGEHVAVKVLRATGNAAREELATLRFNREIEILKTHKHPNIIRLLDAGESNGIAYLVMERIDGVSLLSIRRRGAFEFEPLIELGINLASALHHLHEAGVIHRDIKPANVLIRQDGRPILTDFGISGSNQAADITRQGDLLGSPGFMSPELIRGQAPSIRSDQFALGRLLFELGAKGPAAKLSSKLPILEVLPKGIGDRLESISPWA